MYDDSYGNRSTHAQTPGGATSPSTGNIRSQAMNPMPNDLSASGPGPARGVQVESDGALLDFSQLGPQQLLAPFIQGAFQHDPLRRNPGSVYSGGPPHEPNLSTTTSSLQGGGDAPTTMPYGVPPPTALPNVPSGQAGNPGTSFQVAGQPPTMTWFDRHPEVFARPDAPPPLWRLFHAELEYQGGDDLRVVIHFKRFPSP